MATETLSAERGQGRAGRVLAAAGSLASVLGFVKDAAAGDSIPAASLMRRAALHALNRMGFGPRPGDIDRVLDLGLERWVDDQFRIVPDPDLDARMSAFNYLYWTMQETWSYYQIDQATGNDDDRSNNTRYITTLNEQQRTAQIVRSVHSRNQLLETMAWFWFNHFNVYINDGYVRYSAHDYEKELRRHALGRFRDLLWASAHHPAMMSYLDNDQSKISRTDPRTGRLIQGLNENYGRELLELHTVGVDAGYTQDHVYEAARVLTGWSFNSAQGRFVFNRNDHDPKATEVFGLQIPGGASGAPQNQQRGEMLLDYLARHPSTAQFISGKLVRHFVNDDPPPRLVAAAAATFLATDGDIAQVLRTIFGSKEFWAEAFGPGKYKTPFQYVVSTLRAVDADVRRGFNNNGTDAQPLSGALANMGQPQYGCIPPTGWSDKGRDWVNASSHMYRMNFALDLVTNAQGGNATQPFLGVSVDIPKLLRAHGVDAGSSARVADFFNREIFGGRLTAPTLSTLESFDTTGAVTKAHRVTGLVLAGPEAQGR